MPGSFNAVPPIGSPEHELGMLFEEIHPDDDDAFAAAPDLLRALHATAQAVGFQATEGRPFLAIHLGTKDATSVLVRFDPPRSFLFISESKYGKSSEEQHRVTLTYDRTAKVFVGSGIVRREDGRDYPEPGLAVLAREFRAYARRVLGSKT